MWPVMFKIEQYMNISTTCLHNCNQFVVNAKVSKVLSTILDSDQEIIVLLLPLTVLSLVRLGSTLPVATRGELGDTALPGFVPQVLTSRYEYL